MAFLAYYIFYDTYLIPQSLYIFNRRFISLSCARTPRLKNFYPNITESGSKPCFITSSASYTKNKHKGLP